MIQIRFYNLEYIKISIFVLLPDILLYVVNKTKYTRNLLHNPEYEKVSIL